MQICAESGGDSQTVFFCLARPQVDGREEEMGWIENTAELCETGTGVGLRIGLGVGEEKKRPVVPLAGQKLNMHPQVAALAAETTLGLGAAVRGMSRSV